MAKNWAIVIGINQYNPLNFSRLNYAKHDAEKMKAFFDEMGFDAVYLFTDDSPDITLPHGITIPSDPTHGNLVTFLEDRFQPGVLTTGDNCWFFFAGHGERHDDKDYLMPRDANSRGKKVISGLLVDDVRDWLTRSGADNVILLLDACRSEGSRGASGIDPTEQKGVITIASCNPTEIAWEIEELGQGVFTYALLEALQLSGAQSCATVERLSAYLKTRVPELCTRYGKATQIPRIHVDPLEKQHFILMPRFARQADIDLMKHEGFRLAFEGRWQLAEQMFIRVNVAAAGRDLQALSALTEVRMRMQGLENSTSRPITDNPGGRQNASSLQPTQSSRLNLSIPAAPQPSDDITLESEKGIDYTKLRDLLKAGKWKEADQETYLRMMEVVGRKNIDYIRAKELETFPCKDLKTIDHLWVAYSKGYFGFSVQKKIWQDCGSPTSSGKDWDRFCLRVGWQNESAIAYVSYSDFKFDPVNSSVGKLPLITFFCFWWGGSQFSLFSIWFSRVGAGGFSSLAQRLVKCNIAES